MQPPRQLPPKKSKEGVTRGVSRLPVSRAQGLLASDVCASTDVFAPKLGRETVHYIIQVVTFTLLDPVGFFFYDMGRWDF